MIFDTTFLIDLQRELRRGEESGRAGTFLANLEGETFRVAFVTRMEFAEGFAPDRREECELFLASFGTLYADEETCWQAGQISRSLRETGEAIGDHDVWIAALGLQHGEAVVTRNEKHLVRVEGLEVQGY
ncbi:MAG: type II toxin-antitoxin system VapC family toxin [Verrucomicrobiota bacterium]